MKSSNSIECGVSAIDAQRRKFSGRLIAACAAAAGATFNDRSWAQAASDYPNRPIKIIVPGNAGGIYDIVARVTSNKLAEQYKVPVIIDNRVGAGGIIGAEVAARAAPDGYTIFIGTIFHTILPALKPKLSYDIEKDFMPVSFGAMFPLVLLVNVDLPVRSVQELIAYEKAHPGKLSFASTGVGGGTHLSGELFNVKAQTKMLHVPYKGSVAAITDLMAGQVQVFFSDAPTAIPQIKAGKVRALAVASAQRTSFFPDLPTIAESGLPGFEAYTWGGFMVPRGTPEAIVQQLSADIGRALADPVIKQKLSDVGAEARPDSPAEFRQLVRSEIAKWGDVVRKTGITAE